MDMTLLKEGAIIMAIGMGTVFFFLIIINSYYSIQ